MSSHRRNVSDDISSHSAFSRKKLGIALGAVAVIAVLVVLIVSLFHPGGKKSLLSNSTSELVSEVSEVKIPKMAQHIIVGKTDVSGMTKEEAIEAVKKDEKSLRDSYDVKVIYGKHSLALTQDDLKFTYDIEDAVNSAMEYSESVESQPVSDASSSGISEEGKTFPVKVNVSFEGVEQKLLDFTRPFQKKPVNATVVSFDQSTGKFRYENGKDGVKIDNAKLYKDVMAILKGSKTGTVEVKSSTVPFNKTVAQVASHMQKLGTFSTYSRNSANGNHNMRLGLAAINGKVVAPGAVLSFNGSTGNTSNGALGYKKAGSIVGGKLVQEYGGGICQVSTTLYGAALRSNMDVVSRYNHLWPSSYCPIGLDATINYPGLDLKLRNTTDYPIFITAGMSGTKLTVTLYGYQAPFYDHIEITSKQTKTIPKPTTPTFDTDPDLKKGEYRQLLRGNSGREASATRLFYKNGKLVKSESLPSSYYRPVAPRYAVGPGTDTSKIGGYSKPPQNKPASKPQPKPKPEPKPKPKPEPEPKPKPKPESKPKPAPESSSSHSNSSLNSSED